MAEQTSLIQPHLLQQFQVQSTPSQMELQISSQEQLQQDLLQPPCVKDHFVYKNRLQEFAQRANLPLPTYHTVSEHEPRQSPRFRSTVVVDGETYTSSNTFSTRKAAEQDVAKIALESISKKIKNCVSENTTDGGFPPIHEDRVFCKSILHEFAVKKNLEKPIYDTVRLDSVVPLFVSSLVFDGVKYTGEPSVSKKEAEQLAARAVILSILASSGVETHLSEIVKSKAKVISAVQKHCDLNTSASHLPNSATDIGTSAIKEIAFDNVQEMGGMTGNVVSEELQQQSTGKKSRIPDNANESRKPNLEVPPQPSLLSRYPALPQSSLLRCHQTLSQPSLLPSTQILPQPNMLPNPHAFSQPSLLPSTQTVPQPSMLPNPQTLSQPSLLPSTQTVPQPGLLPSSQTLSQPSLLPSTQTLPQPSLLPNSRTLSQPSLFPSTQTLPQPSLLQILSQPSLLASSQTNCQPSLPPSSQTLPQPNCLPITFTSLDAQIPSNESASSRRRKRKKANKKARYETQMQVSNLPPSAVPYCTVNQ